MPDRSPTRATPRARAQLLALVVCAACGTAPPLEERGGSRAEAPSASPGPGTPTPEAFRDDPSPAELAAATDARDVPPLLLAARSGAVETRRAALLGLARAHGDEAVPGLVLGLRDEDPEARRLAAFGIGALEAGAQPDAVSALLGALAAEPPGRSLSTGPLPAEGPPELGRTPRAMMIWSLARTADPRAVPALLAALRADGDSRVAACRGLAYGPPAGWPDELLEAAVERVGRDPSPLVREACLQGLGRTALVGTVAEHARDFTVVLLSAAPGTPSDPGEAEIAEELRVQAARLLGRLPPTDTTRAQLARSAADPSWRVGVAAVRSLGAHAAGHEGSLAGALRAELLPEGSVATPGPRLQVSLAGLEAALPFARAEAIFRLATELLERLDRPSDEPLSLERGWLHCAAARLFDVGRGWPARVERCGLEQIGEDERRVLAAEVIARGVGADSQRAAYLQRLLGEGGPRARQAVLTAAVSLPLGLALGLARAGLADEDEGVTIAALELVSQLAPMARRERTAEPSSQGSARLMSDLDPLLLAAGRRLASGTSLEGRVTFASTLESLADPLRGSLPGEQLALLRELAGHASHGVRAQALRALAAASVEVAAPSESRPTDTLAAGALALDAREARLVTERGEVVIELFPEVAPTTVSRFVQLAESGFFAGLTFHRVVPGFVAQGGDPRGDGYGGPDFWQRCEDSPIAYGRGVVGMALAGRDTAGSQFFITTGPQHHLDGRYTAFGRVRQGMEHVDRLQIGDPIREVRIIRGD